jgi:hypothetical protein
MRGSYSETNLTIEFIGSMANSSRVLPEGRFGVERFVKIGSVTPGILGEAVFMGTFPVTVLTPEVTSVDLDDTI